MSIDFQSVHWFSVCPSLWGCEAKIWRWRWCVVPSLQPLEANEAGGELHLWETSCCSQRNPAGVKASCVIKLSGSFVIKTILDWISKQPGDCHLLHLPLPYSSEAGKCKSHFTGTWVIEKQSDLPQVMAERLPGWRRQDGDILSPNCSLTLSTPLPSIWPLSDPRVHSRSAKHIYLPGALGLCKPRNTPCSQFCTQIPPRPCWCPKNKLKGACVEELRPQLCCLTLSDIQGWDAAFKESGDGLAINHPALLQ